MGAHAGSRVSLRHWRAGHGQAWPMGIDDGDE
jgi:hypothetical protein